MYICFLKALFLFRYEVVGYYDQRTNNLTWNLDEKGKFLINKIISKNDFFLMGWVHHMLLGHISPCDAPQNETRPLTVKSIGTPGK